MADIEGTQLGSLEKLVGDGLISNSGPKTVLVEQFEQLYD